MNNDAVAKIVMFDCSLRCFTYGLIALLPVIGLPFAILSLWNAGRARVREKTYWNVAKPYRIWGIVCAALGAIFWVTVETMIVYNIATGVWNSD